MTDQGDRYDLECLLDVQNSLGEGPIWDARAARLYWTDIRAKRYYDLDPAAPSRSDGALHPRVHPLDVMVGALALREGGGLVLATARGFGFHDPDGRGGIETAADVEADLPESRMNDGAVDPLGRFWAGTMGEGGGRLYRLDPDRSVHVMGEGFGTPNGIAWSPDGRAMYFTDSDARTIYRADFDPASGESGERLPFIETPDDDGVPDGLAVDAEGFLWSARWDGWRLERYDPDGALERVVMMPVARPTSVAFGGPDLDELYVTSARVGFSAGELERQPLAGGLFRLRPGVRGRPETPFAG